MAKFLFLHSRNEPQEIKLLDTLGSVLFFRESFIGQNSTEIFTKYDVVVLDVNVASYRQWYAAQKQSILGNGHRVIFLHQPHVHIDEKLMKLLKDEWRVGGILKELPKLWNNKEDLIGKIVNNIHLASLDLPEAESCFKSLFHKILEKMSCSSN